MASVLDLVKHYQHAIERNPQDERKVLKSLETLYKLGVTVQHLQETGVGRTVNALRKEPGDIGNAAKALVNKWKLMVASEETSDPEDHESSNYNGHRNGRDSEGSHQLSRPGASANSNHYSSRHNDYQYTNGDLNRSKRKLESDVENSKNRRYSDNRPPEKIKKEQHSESDNKYSDSISEDSDSSAVSSDNDVRVKQEIKKEPKPSSSSHSSSNRIKDEPSNINTREHNSHSRNHDIKTKTEKPSSSSKSKGLNEIETSSSKKHDSEHRKSSSSRHSTSSDHNKHSSSKKDVKCTEKSKSHSEKRESKSDSKHSSQTHKPDKHKSSSDKKHKDSSNHKSKDKSSSKEKSLSSSSRDKASHIEESRHTSSKSSKSSDSKGKSSDTKESLKSSSSHKSSKSSKSKNGEPKKKSQTTSEDSEEGVDSQSGASFAEALGMVSPVKSKKKSKSMKEFPSPFNTYSDELGPASLLSPSAKLAPLPPLEISALPEISPNYKPRPPPKMLPHFTDEEAISVGISTKNQRTKVYSGNKTYGHLPSLHDLCVQVLQEHIDALEFTGGVPYEILKPVIDKATPNQLFILEHYNPYLIEDTNHLWQKFCEKHFRSHKRQELETWREMFMRCQEEQEHRLKSLTENIKIAQEAKKAPIKQTKMAYVDSMVKPPRNIARKQALHGTGRAVSASPAARVASLAAAPGVAGVGGLVRLGAARPTPVSLNAAFKPRKAPLMQKALQFMRGGRKR